MAFDLRTIYAMTAAACLVLGAIQALALMTGRFGKWLAWWAASNIILGASSALIVMRGSAPDILTVQVANALAVIGCLLLPVSVRIFAGRSVDPSGCTALAVLLSLPMIFVFDDPADAHLRVAYGSALFALFDLAFGYEAIRLSRSERLSSARLAGWLFVATAMLYALRCVLAWTGALGNPGGLFQGGDEIHAWMGLSVMAFIALRSMVFLLMAAERAANQLTLTAHRDPLTGVLNRAGLLQAFETIAGRRMALLIVDLDHFKQLNDTGGHALGDRILTLFAGAARDTVPVRDLVARHGGDEFVILLDDADLDTAMLTAERLRIAFGQSVEKLKDKPAVRPTLSIGIAVDGAAADLDILLHKADDALYRAKKDGRNTVHAYRDDAVESLARDSHLGTENPFNAENPVSNQTADKKIVPISSSPSAASLS